MSRSTVSFDIIALSSLILRLILSIAISFSERRMPILKRAGLCRVSNRSPLVQVSCEIVGRAPRQ